MAPPAAGSRRIPSPTGAGAGSRHYFNAAPTYIPQMGSEPVEELPEELNAWVAERAAADGVSRADVVRRLLAAHRLLDDEESAVGDGVAEASVDDLDARTDELADRVGELEADLDDKIADVRKRVIQVKREADAKAPADHDHPAIGRLDEGFENYETILESLADRTDALADEADDRDAKLRGVANAVVDLRRRVAALEGETRRRDAVADIRKTANRTGVSEAACDACGGSVRIGLLDEPACPFCESQFDGVEPGGWFKSNRLTVGDRPALESGRPEPDADDLLERAGSASDGGDRSRPGPGPGSGDAADPRSRAGSAADDDGVAGEPVDDGVDAHDDGSETTAEWVPEEFASDADGEGDGR